MEQSEIIPGIYVGHDGSRKCLITTMDVDLCLSFNGAHFTAGPIESFAEWAERRLPMDFAEGELLGKFFPNSKPGLSPPSEPPKNTGDERP